MRILLKRGSMFVFHQLFLVLNFICIIELCFFFIKTPMSERSVSLANLYNLIVFIMCIVLVILLMELLISLVILQELMCCNLKFNLI